MQLKMYFLKIQYRIINIYKWTILSYTSSFESWIRENNQFYMKFVLISLTVSRSRQESMNSWMCQRRKRNNIFCFEVESWDLLWEPQSSPAMAYNPSSGPTRAHRSEMKLTQTTTSMLKAFVHRNLGILMRRRGHKN